MSEPKLISPMLDGFLMGAPMSSRHGVDCCPAMPKNSDKKYIVKIISIPASQVQLEALLLTGAYSDEEAALTYFKELADMTAEEAQLLKKLASLEGFLPYESWQIVRKEGEAGYQVYLLSPYKRSLERHFRRHTMTHLNAVNLGLDLCASLAVCRRAGYLYVDLKPENIFVGEDGEYRIGDLGFIPLDSLKYASLDEKYHSPYTAPEAKELLSSINETIDTYAVGMILYQTYNDGKLPQCQEGEQLPPPQYADYEMAEIIMKAIDPDPQNRWASPVAMGQALVGYMQKNGANDVPIVAAIPESPILQPQAPADSQIPREASEELPQEASPEEYRQTDEASEAILREYDCVPSDIADMASPEDSKPSAPDKDSDAPEPPAVPLGDENKVVSDPELTEAPQKTGEAEQPDDPANLSFMEGLVADETAPSEEMAPEIDYDELSDEASDILAHADELLAHETPAGVVAPEPIDVPIPPPIVIEEAQPEITPIGEDFQPKMMECQEQEEEEEDMQEAYDYEDEDAPPSSFSLKKLLIPVLILLLLCGLAFGGYYYYREYYLQTISSFEVTGSDSSLSVQIVTDIDESLLTAVCTDAYGTRRTSPIRNGTASFEDLQADTLYTVSVEIDGFHKLIGPTSETYTTPKQTRIISFTAVAGTVEGSVTLRFKLEGQSNQTWRVAYTAEGEEDRTQTFLGNAVTVTGLTVGKTYTFRLESDTPLYIVGDDTLEYTVLALVEAQDLQVTSCSDGKLTAQWVTPEGKTVENWYVRCYNEAGYDQSLSTSGNSAEFLDLDTTQAYTVEVTAEGMTNAARAFVTANSITITGSQVDATDPTKLELSWEYTGTAPEGEWLVLYTIDNSQEPEVARSTTNSVVIDNMVPGAVYSFTIQTQSGVSLFGGEFQVTTPEAPTFDSYRVKTEDLKFTMCQTPDKENWAHKDITNFTSTFQVGQKASFKVVLFDKYRTSQDEITTMYVIRDKDGNLVSKETTVETWDDMWYIGMCCLDVPQLPEVPGDYTMEVYFNGCIVHNQNFSVTQ